MQTYPLTVDKFLDHAANEPLASEPTVDIVKKFKLQQDQLIEVK